MNAVRFGDCRDTMRTMIDEGVKVQMCVTSPPYFGLRDYGTGSWKGGDPDCAHSIGGQVQDNKAPGAIVSGVRPGCDARNCRKCGAVREDKQIGLEQTPAGYVGALVEVFSLASMESLVERTVVPPSLMSTMSVLPVGAVLTEARTAVSVKA